MAFIGIALLIAIGLSVIIVSDAGTLAGITQDQVGQIVPLLLILIVVAAGAFSRRIRFSEMVSSVIMWVAIFGVTITGYTYRYELGDFSSRIIGELMPGKAEVNSKNGIATFRKGFANTFTVGAKVNGAKVVMTFDTGASAVVLTGRDAMAAGIDTRRLRYSVPVQTANGMGRAANIVLQRIEVGGIVRHNIRAFVAEPGALDASLLGMSFLQTLSAYTVTRETLELRN
ncbi:hypothetical protein MNBD_ALPHA12-789 [hydrothermal vent metagenome]|uniref:CblY, a non-orthologous displasment for Alpha-ribazole-5'-phosphate phosphatase n=1 Tax=hydrothermal vent metagenome TaxID=652676 RepID=A0A3B0U224_9ZZZZ